MKRILTVLRFAGAFVCVLALATVVVSAQGNDGKTWDDAVKLFNQAVGAYDQARFQDAIGLFEEALVIMRELNERYTEGAILGNLGLCHYSLPEYQRAIDYYEQALVICLEIIDQPGVAKNLYDLGLCHYSLSEYQRAIDYYEQALMLFLVIDDLAGKAMSLNNLGVCYHSLVDYQRAIDYYEQALVLFREIEDWAGVAMSLNNLGLCYESLSEYWRAIAYYEQALVIKREIEDRSGEANSLYNLGLCYKSLSEYERAIDYHEQALAIFREIEDQAGKAASLNDLGVCYKSLSEYERAIDYHEQSLAICLEIKDRVGVAASLNDLGVCYECLSDYQRAIDHYEQSLAVCLEIDDLAGEAKSLGNLGNCYHSLSDYQRAIDYYEQSLAIFCEIDDRSGEAASLTGLGIYYGSLSEYERAIGYHEQALAICRELNDRAGEAGSLGNLGVCYTSLSDYHPAIDYYEQSLAIFRELGDQAGEATSLGNLGNCYVALSEYQRAIDYYEQSLMLFLVIGDRAGKAMSLNNLGACYLSLFNYQWAIDYYEQALVLSVQLRTREVERVTHWGLGRTYRIMEQPKTALTHYESAIEIVESIRGTVGDEELRQSYFGSLRMLYEEYLELLLELGWNEQTILVAERLRARTFLDTLYQSGLTPEQLQLNETGIDRTSDAVLPVMDFDTLKLAVEEAQNSLLPNEAVIEYMVGDDGIYVWIVTSEGTLGPQFIPYDREQLLRDVVELRRAIEPQTREVNGQPEIFFSDPSEPLGAFYELLIQPVLSQLAGVVDTLIIIPSGPLWYVPFSALVMTDRPQVELGSASVPGSTQQYRPRYLIDNYTLAFLPSLASLPMLMEERAPSTATYLALANPTLSEEQQKEVGSHYQFSVLETACLAFAECIGKGEAAVHVQKVEVHVQEEALEARAYNEAAGHEVLVYACHGIFNPSVPLESRLLLAPSQEEEQERTGRRLLDGNYYVYEVILTDHTGVDLVILAACETLLPTLRGVKGALGMTLGQESDEKLNIEQLELIVAGDEVVGLSRAFLSSGAQSVLGTLWQANPTAIKELMVAMCEAYPEEGGSWAMALKEAQCAILAESNSTFTLTYQTGLDGAHPWFWGAYQLIGRWR